MSESEVIVGIDLGTTNSEVAALVDGRPRVLGPGRDKMLPSCVGFSQDGQLLVGQKARNQSLVYPELTVRSIKRKMGSQEKVLLGEKAFTPQEISALILRELAEWATRELRRPVRKAILTVPAYFSDAQRQATREAGALAGLEVVRILNEPTAASLAYGLGDETPRTVLVYDLGGGTFDVSIVTIENDVTEVLASHGNNHLGGDDFDQLILERLLAEFHRRHGIDLQDVHPASYARLRWAAEEAKKALSFEPYATVREEALATKDGRPLHLEAELSREEYEEMISPLVETTLDSVSKALEDAGKAAGEIDAVLLVGGSTRTPLISAVLEERVGIAPRQEVHPDLCVALGAGLLAGRLAGHDVRRVLVDVSPYSFGPSYLGERDGAPYPYCYHPIIHRNTPLPITRTERYCTSQPNQTIVDIEVFQGDDADAIRNILVGRFCVEGLTPTPGPNEVLCRMSLDLDGILKVTAVEKRTGKSKYITLRDALKPKGPEEIAAARKRLQELFLARTDELDEMFVEGVPLGEGDFDESDGGEQDPATLPAAPAGDAYVSEPAGRTGPKLSKPLQDARDLLERSRGLLGEVHDEDREEIIDLHEKIEQAIGTGDEASASAAAEELRELLFFIEGQ
ncbi:MAG TPA: Hsp70 family protein [Phycisphaerae bacterium]|nr:Hsp70 family protein [Phycisphaerae bacterium]